MGSENRISWINLVSSEVVICYRCIEKEEGYQELDKWYDSFYEKLVELTGRTMKAEVIIYKDVGIFVAQRRDLSF